MIKAKETPLIQSEKKKKKKTTVNTIVCIYPDFMHLCNF